jgi:hypothetical protein
MNFLASLTEKKKTNHDRRVPVMAKDAFDRWWEWLEKPADSQLTIPDYLHDAVMQLPPEQRLNRTRVNEVVRLADPDAQR